MPRLLLRRKSSVKPNMNSVPIVKTSPKELEVEFRWSISAAQCSLLEQNSSSKIHLIDLDESQQKSFFSSPRSTARNSASSQTSTSPRLPGINNPDPQPNPLVLTFSQLYRAQHHPYQTKKNSRIHFSVYPDRQSNSSVINSDVSSPPTIDKYVRLHTPQLRRLHVSEKYIKEAKKLYFNPSSKVFVPRNSIIPVS